MPTTEESMIIKGRHMQTCRLDSNQNVRDLVVRMHVLIGSHLTLTGERPEVFTFFPLRGRKEHEARFQDMERILCRLPKEKHTLTQS